jgi:TPR repeat protein
LAVAQGFAVAQFNLGVMYSDGQGVPQNDAEAVRWYRLAAEQGHAGAQFSR